MSTKEEDIIYKLLEFGLQIDPLTNPVARTFESRNHSLTDMNKQIDKIKKIRQVLIQRIEKLSIDQLNQIPNGYTNNIIWNLIHLISIQQTICYLRAGQKPTAPEKYVSPFGTKTKPDRILDQSEVEEIKILLTTTIDEFQVDYSKELFSNLDGSPNVLKVYGIEITNIDDTLDFLLYHEGYHFGYILGMMRLVI